MIALLLVFFLVCVIVSGIAYGKERYGLSLFAIFWAGYNFCGIIAKVFPSAPG